MSTIRDASKNGLAQTHFTSTFHPLLRSNVIPSTEECESVMAFIRVQEAQLAAVTNTLAVLRKLTERLETQKAVIEQSIGYRRCYLSSARKLPVEILQEIFLHCVPEGRVEICSPQRDLWNVGLVCSQWRGAVLSLRNVWKRLHVDFNADAKGKEWLDSGAARAVFDRRIRSCFERAGELPVSITFEPGTGIPWCTLAYLLSTFGEFSDRWGEFRASLSTWNLQLIGDLFSRNTGALKSVHIEGHNYEGRVLGFFKSTPNLSSLSLSSVRHPSQSIFPISSAGQITTFISTENMYMDGELFEILKLLPNLEHFESNYDFGVDSGPLDEDVELEHSRLTCLNLRARTVADFSLLQNWITPSLTHMDIDLKANDAVRNESCAQTIAAFVRRASGLTHLSIGNIPDYFVEELAVGVDVGCLIEVYGSEVTARSSNFKSLFNRHEMRSVESAYVGRGASWV